MRTSPFEALLAAEGLEGSQKRGDRAMTAMQNRGGPVPESGATQFIEALGKTQILILTLLL